MDVKIDYCEYRANLETSIVVSASPEVTLLPIYLLFLSQSLDRWSFLIFFLPKSNFCLIYHSVDIEL